GALSRRSYLGEQEVVFDMRDTFCPWNEGRWRVTPGGAERTDAAAGLRLDVSALGSVYLGGFTFAELARAGRVEELRPGAPGRVRLVGAPAGFLGYGNVVVVALGGPFETVYAHLASARVSPGETVDAGEPIGVAGCTGWCTGTHLHFELRERGQAIDPSFLM